MLFQFSGNMTEFSFRSLISFQQLATIQPSQKDQIITHFSVLLRLPQDSSAYETGDTKEISKDIEFLDLKKKGFNFLIKYQKYLISHLISNNYRCFFVMLFQFSGNMTEFSFRSLISFQQLATIQPSQKDQIITHFSVLLRLPQDSSAYETGDTKEISKDIEFLDLKKTLSIF